MGYAPERREAVLKKMLPPNNRTIAALAREEGISAATLYGWRNAARREGRLMPDSDTTPQGWTSRDKFAAVLETATMSEAELAEYCRARGLHTTQLAAWRAVCEQANDFESATTAQMKSAAKAADKRERQLAKELARKERALAEAAACWCCGESSWGATGRTRTDDRPRRSRSRGGGDRRGGGRRGEPHPRLRRGGE